MNTGFQLPIVFSFPDKCQFGTFLDTGSNAAALHFLKEFPAGKQQFCLLFGRRGAGKTHLLQALCHESGKAALVSLADIGPATPDILDALEGAQLVVLDDLQLLAGRQEWEEALFRLFNELHAAGARLCVALDRPLDEISWYLPDLHSRLKLAVQYEIHELRDAGKAVVLQREAENRGMPLKPEVVSYLLSRNDRNLHELMAALDILDKLSLSEKRRMTIPFIREKMNW
jgi:DnaA family protein